MKEKERKKERKGKKGNEGGEGRKEERKKGTGEEKKKKEKEKKKKGVPAAAGFADALYPKLLRRQETPLLPGPLTVTNSNTGHGDETRRNVP